MSRHSSNLLQLKFQKTHQYLETEHFELLALDNFDDFSSSSEHLQMETYIGERSEIFLEQNLEHFLPSNPPCYWQVQLGSVEFDLITLSLNLTTNHGVWYAPYVLRAD